jgi:hypothetical protein
MERITAGGVETEKDARGSVVAQVGEGRVKCAKSPVEARVAERCTAPTVLGAGHVHGRLVWTLVKLSVVDERVPKSTMRSTVSVVVGATPRVSVIVTTCVVQTFAGKAENVVIGCCSRIVIDTGEDVWREWARSVPLGVSDKRTTVPLGTVDGAGRVVPPVVIVLV